MPLGLIGFDAELDAEDSEVPFMLYVDESIPVNGFWKQDSTGAWHNLASAEYGGQVTQVGNKIRLDFVIEDNGPFDSDPSPGAISDPGAPGYRLDIEPQPEPEPQPDCPYTPFQPDADADGMPDAVETILGFDPLVKDNDVFGHDELFVRQLYRDLLWREGEAEGLTYWTALLSSGSVDRAGLVGVFIDSAEYRSGPETLIRLYEGTLGRCPETCGLDYWMQQYQAGYTPEVIAQAFYDSQEFSQRYGHLDDRTLIEALYQDVLGREAEPGGVDGWLEALEQGLSHGQLLLGFVQSPEYQALSAEDVTLDLFYLGLLDRAPDAGGYAYWQAEIADADTPLTYVDNFLGSTEYHDRFLPPAESAVFF